MIYRPEIDGLRALAVIPVIFFHAGFELFSGGFVGVDVFFVISGFLITKIITEEIEAGNFSIINFYERRARRILPALFFICLMSIPFSWLFMVPSQIKDFSESLIAISFFASNILFWRESGYFEVASDLKPLLHTWSLAVEEQFYVVFPALLVAVWHFGKQRVFWLLMAIFLASFLLSEWGWRNQSVANFYLAPTRAWEFLVGSMVAFFINEKGMQKNNFISILGLMMILYSIFRFDENTPSPSFYIAMPAIGTALILLCSGKNTFVGKILSLKCIVGVGLISYSAYLWHNPLFAFTKLIFIEKPPLYFMIIITLISFFLAIFTWKYIELPFRNRNLLSNKSIFLFSVLSALFLCFFGLVGSLSNQKILHSYSSLIQNKFLTKDFLNRKNFYYGAGENFSVTSFGDCIINLDGNFELMSVNSCPFNELVLIIGDSHSRDLYQSISNRLKENQSKINFTLISAHKGGCRLTEFTVDRCKIYYEKLAKKLEKLDKKINLIVYVQSGKNLIEEKNLDLVEVQKLIASLEKLSSYADRIKWLGPRGNIGLNRIELYDYCFGENKQNKQRYLTKFYQAIYEGKKIDSLLKFIYIGNRVEYLSQVDLLSVQDITDVTDCKNVFWSNPDHLSEAGEEKFSKSYLKVISY